MNEEKDTRSGGKRERPTREPGRRIMEAGQALSPVTDDTLKLIPQEDMDDGLSMDTAALPKLEDSQIFSLPEEIAAQLPSIDEVPEDSIRLPAIDQVPDDSIRLPDFTDIPDMEEGFSPVSEHTDEAPYAPEELIPPADEEEIFEELLPQEPASEELEAESAEVPSAPQPGRRVTESAQPEKATARRSLWSRAMDTASDLTDRVLDWTEDLTDRFDSMASDPDSEGLVARAIRGSEEILEGLEDQQRETDEENQAEARRRESMEQPRREKKPSAFVFLRSEDLEKPQEETPPAPEAAPEPPETAVSQTERPVEEEPLPEERPRPQRTPLPKEERKQVLRTTRNLQYWFFLIALGFFGLIGLLSPLRATSSLLEERTLTEKPTMTWSGLWSGDYFGRLEQWYSDTFPMRDSLAGEYDALQAFGFGPTELTEASASADDSDSTQETAEESQTPASEAGSEETQDPDSKSGSLELPTESEEGTTTA